MMFVHSYSFSLSLLLTSIQYPETASFLTEPERDYLVELLKIDSQHLATYYDSRFVLQALKDYKTYLQFGIFIGCVDNGFFLTRSVFLTLHG